MQELDELFRTNLPCEFSEEGVVRRFNGDFSIAESLRSCRENGYKPASIPLVVDARSIAPKDAPIWEEFCITPSIKVTGKTKGGSKVVVYAHVPNYFSNPENLERVLLTKGLVVNGAGVMYLEEFKRLLDQEDGENVFVEDHSELVKNHAHTFTIESALEHPHIVAFLGGKNKAVRYLERHRELFGDKIDLLWNEDLTDKPLARFLVIGNEEYFNGCLDSATNLNINYPLIGFIVDEEQQAVRALASCRYKTPSKRGFVKHKIKSMPNVPISINETKSEFYRSEQNARRR